MVAGTYNFTIEQGSDFVRTLTWKDDADVLINLTGYTARMKIKTAVGGTQIISLTQAAGITLGGAAGTIVITITAAQTTAFTVADFLTAVYDLELVSGAGFVTRLIQGRATLSPEVTT